MPLLLCLCHDPGSPHERCHMNVVSTGMHHGNTLTSRTLHDDLTCERKSGFFFDRQGVHVSAQHYGASKTVSQNRDYSCPPHACSHFIAEKAQLFGQFHRGFVLLKPEFRMLME